MADHPDIPLLEYGSSDDPPEFDGFVCRLWEKAMETEGLFRYTLTDVVTRVVEGKYGFVVQKNPKRISHRRRPAVISSLQEPFNPELFNFNKINPSEILFRIKKTNMRNEVEYHDVLINVSPIDYGHCLLVPHSKLCLPQVLTQNSLEMCLELVSMSCRRGFCVVANSLLAYASVNHLHYHFLYIKESLLFERLIGRPIVGNICYELVNHPMPGFGFVVDTTIKECARNVFGVVKLLLNEDIPHNLVIMKGPHFSNNTPTVRVIVIPKVPAKGAKTLTDDGNGIPSFVVAAMEVAGFIVVVDQEQFSTLKESDIIKEFNKMAISMDMFKKLKESVTEKLI